MGRTKSSVVVKEALGKSFMQSLVDQLKTTGCFFSIIIDEIADVKTIKQCAFTVTYYDEISNKVETRFFDMVEVEDSTAHGLYATLKGVIAEKNIPITKLAGFSSDTTNVMFGEYHSVVALLKNDLPNIVTTKCSCHMIHLVASKACSKLSQTAEDLLRNLGSHFHRSHKRVKEFKEFQQFFQVDIHRILSSATTRWLSLKICVDRVLEQYEPLQSYLRVQLFEDPSRTTEKMLQTMDSRFTFITLEFLSYVLGLFNNFNVMFQAEKALLYKLKPEVEKLLTD